MLVTVLMTIYVGDNGGGRIIGCFKNNLFRNEKSKNDTIMLFIGIDVKYNDLENDQTPGIIREIVKKSPRFDQTALILIGMKFSESIESAVFSLVL